MRLRITYLYLGYCPSASAKEVVNYGHSIQQMHAGVICDHSSCPAACSYLCRYMKKKIIYIPALVNLPIYMSTKYCRHEICILQ